MADRREDAQRIRELCGRLAVTVSAFRAGVEGDDVNGELAGWFRPAFLLDVAEEIESAAAHLSALVAENERLREMLDKVALSKVSPHDR